MKFREKELEDIVVTLPFVDGREVDCGVVAAFEISGKQYFVLLPLKEDKKPDFMQSYMIYRVEEDVEQNPIVVYIEDDMEYAAAAKFFSENYLHPATS